MQYYNTLASFLQEAIKRQVNREADREWAKIPQAHLPLYEKPPKVSLTAGLANFLKSSIYQLRP